MGGLELMARELAFRRYEGQEGPRLFIPIFRGCSCGVCREYTRIRNAIEKGVKP